MSEVDAEDLVGCLGSQGLQPFVSEKTQTDARFSLLKGESNTVKVFDLAVMANPVS